MSTTLAVRPSQTVFDLKKDETAETTLQDVLRRYEAATQTIEVNKLSDVVLDTEGKIRNRYRMTTVALSQFCSLLAPGFSQTIYSLSGLRKTGQDLKDDRCDPQMAIRLLNDMIAYRFQRISGYQLVVDRKEDRIEGVIGRTYRFYSNLDMYDRVKSFVKAHKTAPASFTEAILHGRRMLIRYRSVNPIFAVTKRRRSGEPFFGGYQFENTEVGDCALRGSAILIRQWCDNKAVAPFTDQNRVRHVGSSFETRFEKLLSRLDLRTGEATKYHDKVLTLMDTSLGLGEDKTSHAEKTQAIMVRLMKKGLPKGLANRVVRRMLASGSYRSDACQPGVGSMELYAKRNAYDLFNALTAEAKKELLDDRMDAEQLAYSLLMGRFHI